MGLNPGLDATQTSKCATTIPTSKEQVSASFVENGPGVHALPWQAGDWGPQSHPPADEYCWGSLGQLASGVVNGFSIEGGQWAYTAKPGPNSINGETYLHHDGMLLFAIVQLQHAYYGALHQIDASDQTVVRFS
jgi:hypothetical protein